MNHQRSKFFTPLFFLVLLAALFILYQPALENPPRSDYWSAYFFFHWVDSTPGEPGILHVLTYDPWDHGTFRPLSFLVLYLQHHLFKTAFIWSHLSSLLAYFAAGVLLFYLGGELGIDRTLGAIFVFLWAFLFSHFDIVTWTFHIYSLLAFCSFLAGFILFIRYLKSGAAALLVPVGFLFLLGMLSYEIFAAWPLGVVFLFFSSRLVRNRKDGLRPWGTAATLAAVYVLYFAAWLASLEIGRFDVGPGSLRTGINLEKMGLSALAVFFNTLYTGIAVNAAPVFALPALVRDNINLGGLLADWHRAGVLNRVVVISGTAGILLFATAGWFLTRKRKPRCVHLLAFFLFLLFTNFFTITLARLTTNPLIYTFIQFRYQYIPNALVMMMAAAALSELLRPRRREKILIGAALLPVLISNFFLTRTYVSILNQHLRPLKIMLGNIREKMDEDAVNNRAPLYIEDGVAETLPDLCWNRDMARFMRGTYQWFFPREKLGAFTFNRETAAWIIRKEDPTTIERRAARERTNR